VQSLRCGINYLYICEVDGGLVGVVESGLFKWTNISAGCQKRHSTLGSVEENAIWGSDLLSLDQDKKRGFPLIGQARMLALDR